MATFQPIPFAVRSYNDEPKLWCLCCRVLNASYAVLILEVIFNVLIITDTVLDVITSADDPALLALPLILVGPAVACLIALYSGLKKRLPRLLTPYLIWRVIHTIVWAAGEIYFAIILGRQISMLSEIIKTESATTVQTVKDNSAIENDAEEDMSLKLHIIAHQLTIAFIALYILSTLVFIWIIANCRAYFIRKRKAQAEFSRWDRPMRELPIPSDTDQAPEIS